MIKALIQQEDLTFVNIHASNTGVSKHTKQILRLKREIGFPDGASGKESACLCRRHERHGFYSWVRKFPWSRKWQPTPVFLPGNCHG